MTSSVATKSRLSKQYFWSSVRWAFHEFQGKVALFSLGFIQGQIKVQLVSSWRPVGVRLGSGWSPVWVRLGSGWGLVGVQFGSS